MNTAWIVLSACLALKLAYAVAAVLASTFYLAKHGQFSSLYKHHTEPGDAEVYIVIPLLREQKWLPPLFLRFTGFLERFEQIRLVFVTTQREDVERVDSHQPTTADVLAKLVDAYEGPRERILALNYPSVNKVLAEQLNHAFLHIANLPGVSPDQRYLLVYNADSIVDDRTIGAILELANSRVAVAQQSSLFLSNFEDLIRRSKYYLAAHGLRQSRWTLHYEIPRYLFSRQYLNWLPSLIEKNSLIHCVGHGCLIRVDVLQATNGWPTPIIGGEDLALGFVLKSLGYHVLPVPFLENTEMPDTLRQLVNQKAVWFLGTLGYFGYWRFVPKTQLKRRWYTIGALTVQGVVDMLNWLLAGPLMLAYVAIGWQAGAAIISLAMLTIYIYAPIMILLYVWIRLPSDLFPRPPIRALIRPLVVYFIVPILHSAHAFIGIAIAARLLMDPSFMRPKTER